MTSPHALRPLAGMALLLTSGCSEPPAPPRSSPPVDAAEALRPRCDGGDAEACFSLAKELQFALPAEKKKEASIAAYERACELGSMEGCDWLARALDEGWTGVRVVDHARAEEVRQRACQLGSVHACSLLALRFKYGGDHGEKPDPARAVDAFEKACEHGDDRACQRAVEEMTDARHHLAPDPARLEHLMRLPACRQQPGACRTTLAMNLRNHERFSAPPHLLDERVRALLEEACLAREPGGCLSLGSVLAEGIGGPPDVVRAVSLFDAACAEDNRQGCQAAGWTRLVQEKRLDPERAERALHRSCELGPADELAACERRVGSMLADSNEFTRALDVLGRRCAVDDLLACAMQGRVMTRDRRSDAAAVKLFRRACDGGVQAGCESLGMMMADGRGLRRDLAEADRLLSLACEQGEASACPALERLRDRTRGPSVAERLAGMFVKPLILLPFAPFAPREVFSWWLARSR